MKSVGPDDGTTMFRRMGPLARLSLPLNLSPACTILPKALNLENKFGIGALGNSSVSGPSDSFRYFGRVPQAVAQHFVRREIHNHRRRHMNT